LIRGRVEPLDAIAAPGTAPPAGQGPRPRSAGEPAVEALDAAREPRLSFAALSLPPIAAATCVGLSQMLSGQLR